MVNQARIKSLGRNWLFRSNNGTGSSNGVIARNRRVRNGRNGQVKASVNRTAQVRSNGSTTKLARRTACKTSRRESAVKLVAWSGLAFLLIAGWFISPTSTAYFYEQEIPIQAENGNTQSKSKMNGSFVCLASSNANPQLFDSQRLT